MRFTKRRSEFLIARWTAKHALAQVLKIAPTPADLRRLEVRHAPSGAPLPYLDGEPLDLQISLTDRADWAVCVVDEGTGRVGCDLELVEPRTDGFVRDYLTPAEQRYVDSAADATARSLAANLIWSAKESALKVLTTGLRRDTRSVEVDLEVAPTARRFDGTDRFDRRLGSTQRARDRRAGVPRLVVPVRRLHPHGRGRGTAASPDNTGRSTVAACGESDAWLGAAPDSVRAIPRSRASMM